MWDRKILKRNARIALGDGRYRTALMATLLAGIIGGVFPYLYNYAFQLQYPTWYYSYSANYAVVFNWQSGSALPIGVHSLFTGEENCEALYSVFAFLALLSSVFLAIPLQVGLSRFYIRNHSGQGRVKDIFMAFRSGYARRLGALLTTGLLVAVWSLLLVVPGIIKALEYSQVPYLLAENPQLTGQQARQISSRLTNGSKGKILVLQFSFLGWYLLAALAAQIPFGMVNLMVFARSGFDISASIPGQMMLGLLSAVTTYFVDPYMEATLCELYLCLRDRGFYYRFVMPQELGFSPENPPYAGYGPYPGPWNSSNGPEVPPTAPPYTPPGNTGVQ
ncbi:MAG: DUF975 family protein [Candidatus Heritagella sp.]